MHQILESALQRVEHFEHALSLYKKYLTEDECFQNVFLKLLDVLVATERTPSSAKQVFFVAVGKSAGIARVAVSMFVSVGLPVQFVHPTEAFHGDFGSIHTGDGVVFISNNGTSTELLQMISRLNERQVEIFTITAKPKSPLALQSNFVLPLPNVSEQCPLAQAPITSTLTTLALFQLLVAASIEKRNFSIENYAKNHPGGAIGKRIFLKIDEIMSQGQDLPVIESNAKFQKVISVFTTFAKACLLVVENEKFFGLITERDVRKAMETHGASVFEMTAEKLMNPNPKSVRPGLLASDLLQMMTQKKPFLNVMPVVTEEGKAVGLIQIQDLLALKI